jgi:murein DD-endopeptidase MepM/ murein hydrolase activator NlpD
MREWQDGYGKYTCIRHVDVLTCYAHQSRFRTKLGEKVAQGDVIGYTGDTGTSEAPHLHFEVRRGRRVWGKPLNPARYLPREPHRFR